MADAFPKTNFCVEWELGGTLFMGNIVEQFSDAPRNIGFFVYLS